MSRSPLLATKFIGGFRAQPELLAPRLLQGVVFAPISSGLGSLLHCEIPIVSHPGDLGFKEGSPQVT